jgi:hypothetical protein
MLGIHPPWPSGLAPGRPAARKLCSARAAARPPAWPSPARRRSLPPCAEPVQWPGAPALAVPSERSACHPGRVAHAQRHCGSAAGMHAPDHAQLERAGARHDRTKRTLWDAMEASARDSFRSRAATCSRRPCTSASSCFRCRPRSAKKFIRSCLLVSLWGTRAMLDGLVGGGEPTRDSRGRFCWGSVIRVNEI